MLDRVFALLFVFVSGLGAACREDEVTVSGVMRRVAVEGGAWVLHLDDGCTYDLHGDVAGFKDGDRVKVTGVARPDKVCVHMVGPILEVKKIARE